MSFVEVNSQASSKGTLRSRAWMPLIFVVFCAYSVSLAKDPPSGKGGLFGSKGAPWTIRCLELQGPHRRENMEQIAETLRSTPGIRPKDVLIQDDPDGMTRLYYGTYYRKTDEKTGKQSTPKQLAEDLKLIKQLGTGNQFFFLRAAAVRVPTPDVGNPAWRLVDAPGLYSLQVGVFEPTDEFQEFKQAAADYCQLLRDRGYEAYYHHAEAASMVTVGSFGEEALIPQEGKPPTYSAKVLSLQNSDELLKYNLLNGAIYRANSPSADNPRGEKVRIASQLVHIPGREPRP